MSLENEEQLVTESPLESKPESRKQSKLSYTKDFLLSLSNLDICKKLPIGFDASILSELEDASNSILELQRGLGGLPLQGSKRNDYALNRWDGSGSYSRGSSEKWDTRSSGSGDRHGDFQSDRESFMQDSDRRPGNQSRHLWQQPEHDGLLGSGAFPRPSGYIGASEPKARGISHYQLIKSSEPYQPPRPYKAMPFPQKDNKDFCNDETFGSAECSSQKRAEEERKRKSSFELMRKEQQRTLQEKQKHYNNKEKLDADIIALLESSVDKQDIMNGNEKSDDSLKSSLFWHDSSKSSFLPQAPASRPLVPPGFANALVEKSLSVQSSSTSLESEARSAVVEDKIPLEVMDEDQEKRNQSAVCINANVQKSGSMFSEVVKPSIGFENVATMASGLQKVSEVWEDDSVNDFSNHKKANSELVDMLGHNHSTSILEKLFGSALAKNYESSPTYVENQGLKTDEETWSPSVSESSKFARWFFEEEKNPVEDFSSRDLLSLIVNDEKVRLQTTAISNDKAGGHIPQSLAFENNGNAPKLLTTLATSSIAGISEQYHQGDRLDSSAVVLTCEDLEQSILAEVKDSSSTLLHSVQGAWTVLDGESEDQRTNVDDHASQHLLSLLQKGTKKDATTSPMLGMESYDRITISDVKTDLNLGGIENSTASKSERVPGSENALTLEALFGAAFMNELHSVEAPVSVHRGSAGGINGRDAPLSHGLPISHRDVFFTSCSGEYRSSKTIHEGRMVTLNHIQEARGSNIPGPGVDHRDSPIEGSILGSAGAEEGALEIHLPEEDSLIAVSNSLDSITSDALPLVNATKTEELLHEKNVEELDDKLLNVILRDVERIQTLGLDGLRHLRCQFGVVDSDKLYHHLQGRVSLQLPHLMNQTRPLFQQLDQLANRNQVEFIGPEGIHHNAQHPFPANIIPLHDFNNASDPRFDPAAHHLMSQQMSLPVNLPPQYPFQGLPRGLPLSHPINHMPGYLPEMGNVHNFPIPPHQPNNGGLGMGMRGPVVGVGMGGHPEALERLIEMKMRANSKQIHLAAAGHIPSVCGPELNVNFRYR